MTRCAVCNHPERGRIEALLAAGGSDSQVARDFGLERQAVRRHRLKHTSEAAPAIESTALDELAEALRIRALAGDVGAAREYRLSLQALEAARAATRPASDLVTSPEWHRLRTALLDVLGRHPEARTDVIGALARLGSD